MFSRVLRSMEDADDVVVPSPEKYMRRGIVNVRSRLLGKAVRRQRRNCKGMSENTLTSLIGIGKVPVGVMDLSRSFNTSDIEPIDTVICFKA